MTAARLQERLLGLSTSGQGLLSKRGSTQLDPSLTMPQTRGLSRLQSQPQDFLHDLDDPPAYSTSSRHEPADSTEHLQPTQFAAAQQIESPEPAQGLQEERPQSHPIAFSVHQASFKVEQQQQHDGASASSAADVLTAAAPDTAAVTSGMDMSAAEPATAEPDKDTETARPETSSPPESIPPSSEAGTRSTTRQADIGHLVVRQTSIRGDMMRRRSRPSRDVSATAESLQGPADADKSMPSVLPQEQSAAAEACGLPVFETNVETAQAIQDHDVTQEASLVQEAAIGSESPETTETPPLAKDQAQARIPDMTSSSTEKLAKPAGPAAGSKKDKASLPTAVSASATSGLPLAPDRTSTLKLSQLQLKSESTNNRGPALQPDQVSVAAPPKQPVHSTNDQPSDLSVSDDNATTKSAKTRASPKAAVSTRRHATEDAGASKAAPAPTAAHATKGHDQASAVPASEALAPAQPPAAAASVNGRRSSPVKPRTSKPASATPAAAQKPETVAASTSSTGGKSKPAVPVSKQLPSKAVASPAAIPDATAKPDEQAGHHTVPDTSLSSHSKAAVREPSSPAKTDVNAQREGRPAPRHKHAPSTSASTSSQHDNEAASNASKASPSMPTLDPRHQQPSEPGNIPAQEASATEEALASIQKQPSVKSAEGAASAPRPPAILRQQSRFPDNPEVLSSSFRIRKGDAGSTSGNRVQWRLDSDEAGSASPAQTSDGSKPKAVSRQASMLSISSAAPPSQQAEHADGPANSHVLSPAVPYSSLQGGTTDQQHAVQKGLASETGAQPASATSHQGLPGHDLAGPDAAQADDQMATPDPQAARPHARSADKSSSEQRSVASREQAVPRQLPDRKPIAARSRPVAPATGLQSDQPADQLKRSKDHPKGDDPAAAADAAAAEPKSEPMQTDSRPGTAQASKNASMPSLHKRLPTKLSGTLGPSGSPAKHAAPAAGSPISGTPATSSPVRKPAASMSTIKKMSLADLKAQMKAATRRASNTGDHATEPLAQQRALPEGDAQVLTPSDQQQQQQGRDGSFASPARGQHGSLHAKESVHLGSQYSMRSELAQDEASISQDGGGLWPELIKAHGGSAGEAGFDRSTADLAAMRSLAADSLPGGVHLLGRRASTASTARPKSAASSASSASGRRSSVMSMAEAKVMAANLKAANVELGKPDLRRRLSLAANTAASPAADGSEKLTDYQALLADANLLQSMRSSSAARLSGDHDFASSWLSGRPSATPKFALSTPGIPARNWHLTLRQYPEGKEPGDEHRAPSTPSRSKLGTRRSSMTEIDAD